MTLRDPLLPYYMKFRDEAGDGDGGGGGDGSEGGDGEGNGDGDGKPASDPRLDTLENAVRLMAQGQAAINETLANLSKGFETLSTRVEDGGRGKGGNGEAGADDDDPDLETMDRKQFANYMTKKMQSVVEGSLKPLGEKFGKLDEKIDAHGLSVMIKDFQKDHPDFFEWKPEMRELLKENPTLTPARAYALVRSESPDKAKQLDKKYGLNQPTKKNGENNFLSLFPTGSGSATKGNAKMTPQQAAEQAWDSVMSSLQGN